MAREREQRLLLMGVAVSEFGGVVGTPCAPSVSKAQWLLGEAVVSLPVVEHPGPDDVFLLLLVVDQMNFTVTYRRVPCAEIERVSAFPVASLKEVGRTHGGFGCLAVYQENDFLHSEVLEMAVGRCQTVGGPYVS